MQLFQLAVQNARDAIFIDDADGRLVYANSAFFTLFGFDPQTPLAEIRLEDYVHEDDRRELRERHERRIGGEEVPDVFSYRGVRRDGKELSLEVHVTPVSRQGQIVGTHSVVRDIAHRVRIEEQQCRAQRLKAIGRLTAGIAHDFNGILHGIEGHAGFAQQLLNDGGDDDEMREHLEVILSSSARGVELIRRLVDFARGGEHRPELLDINPIVKQALRLLGTELRSRTSARFEIVQDLSASTRVSADPTQVFQIVQNLVLNARDAMPEGGEITVCTADVHVLVDQQEQGPIPSSAYTVLKVSDTGDGIPAEARQRMFEPFFTTKSTENSGLGLSIVFGIVKRHGGYIKVDSESGTGTSFSVYLPAE